MGSALLHSDLRMSRNLVAKVLCHILSVACTKHSWYVYSRWDELTQEKGSEEEEQWTKQRRQGGKSNDTGRKRQEKATLVLKLKLFPWCLKSATFQLGCKKSGLHTCRQFSLVKDRSKERGGRDREGGMGMRSENGSEFWERWQKPGESSLHACDSSWNPIHWRKGRWHSHEGNAQGNEASERKR